MNGTDISYKSSKITEDLAADLANFSPQTLAYRKIQYVLIRLVTKIAVQ